MIYRVMFSDLAAAVEGLLTVIEDAEVTDKDYSFGPLSAGKVQNSGMLLIGDVDEVAVKLDKIDGATRYAE